MVARRWACGFVAVVLAAGVALFGAPAASAADGVIAPVTSADAYAGGLAIPQWPDRGGWSPGPYASASTRQYDTLVTRASELYTDGARKWFVSIQYTAIDDTGGSSNGSYRLDLFCATSATTAGQAVVGGVTSAIGDNVQHLIAISNTCPAGRDYLAAARLRYWTFDAFGTVQDAYMWWWPGDYYGQKNVSSYESGLVAWCQKQATRPECAGVVDKDGTSFAEACANPPEADWLSFSWLGPWVGHYARCLTVPLNGWDPSGKVDAAVESGAVGDVRDFATGLGSKVHFSESCGVLGSVAFPGGGAPLTIDTCTGFWTRVGPIKALLSIALAVGAALYGFSLIIKSLGPNYLGFDDKDLG